MSKKPFKSSKRVGLPKSSGRVVLPWSPKQLARAEELAAKHGMSLDELMAIIDRETGGTFNPVTGNEIGATGLIQFTGSTGADFLLQKQRKDAYDAAQTPEEKAQALRDNKKWHQLTAQEKDQAAKWARSTIRGMDVYEQLDLADQLLTQKLAGAKGFDNAYSAIFAGTRNAQGIGKSDFRYAANKSVDTNQDGMISRAEWLEKARKRLGARPPELTLPETPEITPAWAWGQGAFAGVEPDAEGFKMPPLDSLANFPDAKVDEILQGMKKPELTDDEEA